VTPGVGAQTDGRASPARGGGVGSQELNRDFLTLLANTSDFIYFKDQDSRIRFCSQALATLCGYRDWREMIGKHDLELFPAETARIYYEEELPIFQEGKALLDKVDPYIDLQGARRWVSTNKWPVFGEDGRTVVGLFGISRDVTDRKRAEAEREHHSLRYQALLGAAADGIHVLDLDGNVLEANDAFCRMLGYTREEALALNVSQWDARWTADELRTQRIPRVLGHREVFETKHRRRDGTILDVEVSAAGVAIDGEQMLFAASRDITERKRAEERIGQLVAELTEANRMKDIFTDILRHDVLNAVNSVMLSNFLLLKKETDPERVEILQRVRRSALDIAEMAENAARLASLTAGQTMPCGPGDPAELLGSVLSTFEQKAVEKSLSLVNRSSGGFTASFNPIVKDVFANLVANAVKYSPAGTRIDVGVEDRGETWCLCVRDQGDGIPEGDKERIFNRFERLGKKGIPGTGLGLAIAKEIVRLHGGRIWVEDNHPSGSVFFAQFPKVPGAAQPIDGASSASHPPIR
jgi:PAS domain S-box-containing protein